MSIKVRILGDDSDLQSKLGGASKAIAKWGAAAAASAAAAGIAMTKAGMDMIDSQAKLARSLGGTINSLQAVKRAARDTGLEGLDGSLARLNRRLGAAEFGAGAAAKTVEILNLDLEALGKMDTDEKLSSIAESLRESGVSSQQAARHLQNLGFEQSQALEFFMEGIGAVDQYKKEIDALGLSLSEVDAAQVEAAGDAMGVFGDMAKASSQQMAVQFAPILGAVADLFKEQAIEAGGFGQIAERVFDVVIKGAGFAADAIRGLQVILKGGELAFRGLQTGALRAFQMILEGWDYAANSIAEGINTLIRGMNRLPKVDIEELITGESQATETVRRWADGASAAMGDAGRELHELLMQPLPSEGLKDWVDNVKAAAEEAARETVAAREAIAMSPLPPMEDEEDEEAARLLAEKQAKEMEKLREHIQARVETIRQGFMSEQELAEMRYEQGLEDLQQAHELELLELDEYHAMRAELEERYNADTQARTKARIDAEMALERAANKAKLDMLSQGLGNMATLMNTENRKLFEIGKVAAISQALVDGYAAVTSSYRAGAAIGGPIVGAAFAGTAAVATGVQIARLSATSYGSKGAPSAGGGGQPSVPQQQMQGQQQPAGMATINITGDTVQKTSVLELGEQLNELADQGFRFRFQ
jgi:hypothetical protein